MNKLILMVAAAVLSTSSFAGIVSDSYNKSKFGEDMQQAKDGLKDARDMIRGVDIAQIKDELNSDPYPITISSIAQTIGGRWADIFEIAGGSIRDLQKMINPASDEATQLYKILENLHEEHEEICEKIFTPESKFYDGKTGTEQEIQEITEEAKEIYANAERQLESIIKKIEEEIKNVK